MTPSGEENVSSLGTPRGVVLHGACATPAPQRGGASSSGAAVQSGGAVCIVGQLPPRGGGTLRGKKRGGGGGLLEVNVLRRADDGAAATPLGFLVIAPDVSVASLTTALCGACGGAGRGANGGADGSSSADGQGSNPLSVVATLLDIAGSAPTAHLNLSGSLDDGAAFDSAFGAEGNGKRGDTAFGLVRLELFAPPGDSAALARTMRALGIRASNVARLLLFGEECAPTLLAHDPQKPGACAMWRLAAGALLFEDDVEDGVDGAGADVDAPRERACAASFDALAHALKMEADRSSNLLCTEESAAALCARLQALLVELWRVKEEGLRTAGGYCWRDASDVLAAQTALRAAVAPSGGRGGGDSASRPRGDVTVARGPAWPKLPPRTAPRVHGGSGGGGGREGGGSPRHSVARRAQIRSAADAGITLVLPARKHCADTLECLCGPGIPPNVTVLLQNEQLRAGKTLRGTRLRVVSARDAARVAAVDLASDPSTSESVACALRAALRRSGVGGAARGAFGSGTNEVISWLHLACDGARSSFVRVAEDVNDAEAAPRRGVLVPSR